MFRRILIANRGEVAARVLRTCRRLGIETVAAVAEPDAKLAWLREVDTIVPIGGRGAYLDMDALIHAARAERCSAIHPGWGFLSENALFATRCEAERITFIGPSAGSIRTMGDKSVAKETMRRLGLPLIPGSDGPLVDVAHARALADAIGYPVLLKARSGGGGRGMRRVNHPDEVAAAYSQASAEAHSAFGDGALYLEKLIENGRHVEFQVMGDCYGNVVCLGERECSVQRRHQKLIEESPSPAVTEPVRGALMEQVAAACARAGYVGAGTVEMLRDRDGALYFMEMNTRLQVEHSVTEMVTGIDLVEHQLRVAAHERLRLPAAPARRGHAIECRINAEDPEQNFRPAPGLVHTLHLPEGEGVRVDTHLREGDSISPHYDSLIAKVITWGEDRATALERMQGALKDMVVGGVPTTIGLHLRVLSDPRFQSGVYDTGLLGA